MTTRYLKTDAGRAALRERTAELPRVARTLLLIIDDSKPAGDWLVLVAGSSDATLQTLLERGYIGAVAAPAAATAAGRADRTNAHAPAPSSGPALDALLQALSYRDLYDQLTVQARPMLGLMASYKFVLDIERCRGVEDLRALAARFVDAVRTSRGPAVADALCRGLADLAAATPTTPEPAPT